MGIKFDILTESLLLEDSDFSQFFTSDEPIKLIHAGLKVDANTKLSLSPTNNSNVLWDELRSGKAIFISIHKSKAVLNSLKEMKDILRGLPVPENRAQTYNEIKDVFNRIEAMIPEGRISSADYIKIRNKLKPVESGHIPNHRTVVSMIRHLWPTAIPAGVLVHTIDVFLEGIKPGNYILVKRLPYNKYSTNMAQIEPQNRSFPERAPENKKEKIFGQQYVGFIFDGDRLVERKHWDVNSKTVWRELVHGWGDRDFYVVNNENFLKTKRHPFMPTKDVQFVEIIPLDVRGVVSYVQGAMKSYDRIVSTKIKEMAGKLASRKANDTKIEEEWKKAQDILKRGVNGTTALDMFRQYIGSGPRGDISKYMIISGGKPFDNYDPWSNSGRPPAESLGEWQQSSKEAAMPFIDAMVKGSGIYRSTEEESNVRVRSRSNPEDIKTVDIAQFAKTPEARNYMMFNPDRNKWVPIDASYKSKYTNGNGANFAVAFENIREFNEFTRNFVLFVMRNLIKSPGIKQLENIMSML